MESNLIRYQHTQTGYLMISILIILILLFAYILTISGNNFFVFMAMVIVLVIIASFSSLKIAINQKHLQLKFGYGIFSKKFILDEIASVRAVRNNWYHGWGIRVWFWPKMWIYNVSGFEAVQLTMKNGGVFRIGTDESQKLAQILNQVIINSDNN